MGQANDSDGCLLDSARIDDLECRARLSSIDHKTDQPTIVLTGLRSTGHEQELTRYSTRTEDVGLTASRVEVMFEEWRFTEPNAIVAQPSPRR